MGLQTNKDDDYNADLLLEKMMNEFEIDLDEEETEKDELERINRRREKIKKERE